MYNNNYDYKFKYIIVGDSGVGKSSILEMFIEKTYHRDHAMTIGVDFKTKNIYMDNYIIKLFIWDTAGQEMFKSIISSYYRNIMAALIVFDLGNINSFWNCEKWLEEIKKNVSDDNIIILLVGNKCDNDIKVNQEDIEHFCKRHNINYIRASVKQNININKIFFSITKEILSLKDKNKEVFKKWTKQRNIENILVNTNNNTNKKKCCKLF